MDPLNVSSFVAATRFLDVLQSDDPSSVESSDIWSALRLSALVSVFTLFAMVGRLEPQPSHAMTKVSFPSVHASQFNMMILTDESVGVFDV
eukprot:2901897-Rhodomonas_salina.2